VGSGVSVKGFSPNFDEFVRTNFYHRAHRGHRDKLKKLSEVFGPEKNFPKATHFSFFSFWNPPNVLSGRNPRAAQMGKGSSERNFGDFPQGGENVIWQQPFA
jgi:hypothetical protein